MSDLATRSRRAAPLLALLLAGPLSGPAAAQQPAPPERAGSAPEPLLDPLLDHGDPAAAQEALLRALEADPRDPRAPYVLSALREVIELVPGGLAAAHARLEPLLGRVGDHASFDELAELVARLRLAAGDRAGAYALTAQRGLLDEALVAGPFGVARRAALERVFPPEVAAARAVVDPAERFAALRGERGWQRLTREPRNAHLDLADAAEGEGQVCYLLTHVEAPGPLEAALTYRGPSAKVWVNRAHAGTIDRSRERLSHEVRLPIRLVAGWNRLLIKVAGGAGPSVQVRLATPAGGPLVLPCSATPREVAAVRGEPGAPLQQHTLAALAQEQAPERRGLYVHALLEAGLSEEANVALEDLRAAAPALEEQAWLWNLAGRAAEQAEHLPQAVQRERARTAYERARALDPASSAARRALARFSFRDDRVTEGALLLEEGLARAPGDLATRLALVRALVEEGWLHPAEQVLAGAPTGEPAPPALLRAQADLLERRGRRAEAQEARERLLAQDQAALWVVGERLKQALRAADAPGALAALAAVSTLGDPTPDERAEFEAGVWRSLGDPARELAARRRWLEAQPHDVGRRLAVARRLAELGPAPSPARTEAIALLEGLVAERPELHEARELLEALGGEEDRFWEEWTPALSAILERSPGPEHWPRASTVCLFDQTVTKIYPDASTVDVVHQVWRILDESGKERYGSRPRVGELLEVRTITPAGEVLEPIRTGTDRFEMPGLAPGAVVEHAFRLERRAPDFQYTNGPFYFQDPDLREPFWLSRWVLIVHQDAPVEVVERNLDRPGITRRTLQRGPWRVHVYTAKDQPRHEPEPFAPDRDELLPWIKVVERRSLDAMASLYLEQALALGAVTPTVARQAAALTEGVPSDSERARRLYRFVQEHVTSDSGGYTAAQILAARGGSKTTLLRALLLAADVPHDLALAGPSPYADGVEWGALEPSHFSLPLLRIAPRDGAPHYLLPEAHRLAPYGDLPFQLFEAPVFVCDPAGGWLDVIPSAGLAAETQRSTARYTLQPGGDAEVSVTRSLPGFGYYRSKEVLASAPAAQLRAFFAGQAAELQPGARLLDSATPEVDVPGAPLAFALRFLAPGAVRPRGDGALELRGLLSPTHLRRTFGTHPHRAFDLVLGAPVARHDVVEVDLGPYACPLLPPSVRLSARFGQYSLVIRRGEGGRIALERRLLLRPGRIEPAEYARELLPFLQRVDEADQTALVLEPRRTE